MRKILSVARFGGPEVTVSAIRSSKCIVRLASGEGISVTGEANKDRPWRLHRRSPGRVRVRDTVPVVVAALLGLALFVASPAANAQSSLDKAPKRELERLKLAEEVEKLRKENDTASGWSGFFVTYAPFLTALVAVAGVLATVWKQGADQNAQRSRDREQRQVEDDRRLEDRFASILAELGTDTVATRAGAAASLVTYLRPEHRRFHHQVRLAVLTNLKLDQEEPIRKLLVRVYDAALRSAEPIDRFERDLSRARLAETDLSGVDLSNADLAFADLRNASLIGSILYRARGLEVDLRGARVCASGDELIPSLVEVRFHRARGEGTDFSGAVLVNAHLKEADLRTARFYQAHLQAAHLEGANLAGAQFQMANVADTYFIGATFDEAALRSLARALNWRKAHLDPAIREELERLSAEQGERPGYDDGSR